MLSGTVGNLATDKLVAWREGDEITRAHRLMLAHTDITLTNVHKEKEAKVYEKYLNLPAAVIADMLAMFIATYKGMDVDSFKQQFPTLASESNSPTVTNFLKSESEAEQEWSDLLEN
jgi:tRNA A-37 threonylcarbamoyl transferase component Bud32